MKGSVRVMSSDKVVKPRRASLMLGMEGVKRVAHEAGAFSCTISGPQPIMVAVNDNEEKGRELLRWLLENIVVAKWWGTG